MTHTLRCGAARHASVLMLALLINGCSMLPTHDPTAHVDTLIERGEFERALAFIDQFDDTDPNHSALQQQRKQVQQKRSELDQLSLKWALRQTQVLPQSLALLTQMQTLAPQLQLTQDHINALETQLAHARERLIRETKTLIAKRQWQQADKTIRWVEAVGSDAISQALRQQTQTAVASERNKRHNLKQRSQTKMRQQKLQQLLAAIRQRKLLHGKSLAEELRKWQADAEVGHALTKFEHAIRVRVEQLDRSGELSYAEGQLDQAIEHWRHALRLNPDNENLKTRLHRAEVFRDNYKKMQKNGGTLH